MSDLQKKAKSRIYFASDFHLGVPDAWASAERERRIVRWLDCIEENAKEIFLLGDVFDFWFEYRDVVPKGYVRLLGKLATMADNGCKIHFVCGNHDLWIRDYFEKDLGFIIHRSAFETIDGGLILYHEQLKAAFGIVLQRQDDFVIIRSSHCYGEIRPWPN